MRDQNYNNRKNFHALNSLLLVGASTFWLSRSPHNCISYCCFRLFKHGNNLLVTVWYERYFNHFRKARKWLATARRVWAGAASIQADSQIRSASCPTGNHTGRYSTPDSEPTTELRLAQRLIMRGVLLHSLLYLRGMRFEDKENITSEIWRRDSCILHHKNVSEYFMCLSKLLLLFSVDY
jgi:hypothetical protein